MTPFRFTLRGDGPSDDMLLPVIRWVLMQHLKDVPLDGQFADWRALPRKPVDLADEIAASLKLFPCDLLVVHRDVETKLREERVEEIRKAVEKAGGTRGGIPPHVCVIPVRMSEAWMLFDEQAIRCAAENPNGKCKLNLPPLKRVESIADPKGILNKALITASELSGRRLEKFVRPGRARRVAEAIENFTPLRQLPAFKLFEADIRALAESWEPPE
jgi:ATP-dependent Clp protease ATP-binding subunit ClpA